MIYIRITKDSGIIAKIRDFYLTLFRQRLYSNARHKYSINVAKQNIRNTLSIVRHTFDDADLRRPTLSNWKQVGWHELVYNRWHFAVLIQLDIFDNCQAIVQDCCHDKDYHNDTMETQPFTLDNPNDMSNLVDWKEFRIKQIIKEVIQETLRKY